MLVARYPPATKGHGNLSNLSNKQKKATLKYDKRHTPSHTNELIQDGKFAEVRCRITRSEKINTRRASETLAPTFIHAYHSHKRSSPSNESNMLAGEPAGFRLTMTRSRFPERSRPFCVEFACFRRCPPAAFLLAVQRLIGGSEFPRTVGVSCKCVRCDEKPTWPAPDGEMEDGCLHPGSLSG